VTTVADVHAQLVLDDDKAKTTLEKDLPASAEKGGTQAGQRFGGKMGTAVKATLGGLAGGIAGGMFAIATKGAAELNSAVSSFAADTGATQAEIESAQGTISDLYKSNLQGFDQIGDAMAALRTEQGLTQESAEEMTQSYLDFATATGQEAASAVGDFDDVLDAWGLEAGDAQGIMDKLVTSHQKYGGSIEENQKTLASLAPALKAANMTVDDGIGVLNLFAASGVDASTASGAFSKALTKVKSPEELNKLIAEIQATEDPFARAQKASELFGAKAGPKLAQALAQGNLEDFQVSLEESEGSAGRAAAAIEGSFGNQAQLMLKNFGGTLAEAGSNFGPLLLGFTSLLPMAAPIMTAAGGALGGLLAAAIPIGMALLPVILIAAIVAAIAFLIANPEITAKIGEFVGDLLEGLAAFLGTVGQVILDAFTTGFAVLGQVLETALAALGTWVGEVVAFFLSIPEAIGRLIGDILGIFGQIGATVLGAVTTFIGNVVGFYLSIPGRILGLVGQIAGVAAKAAAGFLANVVRGVGVVVSTVLGIPGKLLGLVGSFANIARKAVEAFMGFILGLPGKVAGVIGDIGGKIGGFLGGLIPKFAMGTDRVPYTGMAMVHEGEMIVPARAAAEIRGGEAVLNYGTGLTQKQQAVNVTVNNPIPEPAGTSVAREMRKLAYMGVVS
jgi:hypothetical protein